MSKHIARSLFVVAIAVLVMTGPSAAQTRPLVLGGTVIAVFDRSFTVSAGGEHVAFMVAKSTRLVGKGRATLLPPAGRPFRVADALKEGDRVTVTYREARGVKYAQQVVSTPTESQR
jgi:hypothetical protein